MDHSTSKIIACKTVIEELKHLKPEGMAHEELDFGLHNSPKKLNELLQETIDRSKKAKTLILGYGLCSQAVIGLKASHCTLVVPKVDDCIALFLGSSKEYRERVQKEPGTYYLTKGWIEACDSPFEEFDRLKEKYGPEKAQRIMDIMLKNYKSLAFINTGNYKIDSYRSYVQETAKRFCLQYDEIKGSTNLLTKMIHGPWDDEFIVISKGESVSYDHFRELRGI